MNSEKKKALKGMTGSSIFVYKKYWTRHVKPPGYSGYNENDISCRRSSNLFLWLL